MTVSRSPVALAIVLIAAGSLGTPAVCAQGIVDTLRDVLGPPVVEGAPSRSRPRAPAAAEERPATPAIIPVPSARPGGPDTAPDAVEGEPPIVPAADEEDPVPASPSLTDAPNNQASEPSDPVEPAAAPVSEPSPQDEAAPEAETSGEADAVPENEPETEPDADAEAVTAPTDAESPEASKPTETPGPAYVSPDNARTVPEPSAPATPASDITPEEATEAAAAVEDARICEEELKARGAEFTTGPSLADGGCGVLRPVQLTRLSSGITITPATQMLCRTALALDIWASDGVGAAARNTLDGDTVAAIEHASTYVCRDRASESGISEHGRGSAIDISAFVLADGQRIVVEDQVPQSPEDRFLADARRAACGPFATVLGPGTDADHADHLHLDIAARANGSLYCR